MGAGLEAMSWHLALSVGPQGWMHGVRPMWKELDWKLHGGYHNSRGYWVWPGSWVCWSMLWLWVFYSLRFGASLQIGTPGADLLVGGDWVYEYWAATWVFRVHSGSWGHWGQPGHGMNLVLGVLALIQAGLETWLGLESMPVGISLEVGKAWILVQCN